MISKGKLFLGGLVVFTTSLLAAAQTAARTSGV